MKYRKKSMEQKNKERRKDRGISKRKKEKKKRKERRDKQRKETHTFVECPIGGEEITVFSFRYLTISNIPICPT